MLNFWQYPLVGYFNKLPFDHFVVCVERFFLFRKDSGLPESAIANSSVVFIFNLTICPLRLSSDSVFVFFISNDSDIAITENSSIC